MLFDEEWYERQMEKLKDEYREEGLREGISQGISQKTTDVTRAMILKGYPDTEIIEIAGITSELLSSVKQEFTNSKQTKN